MNTAEFRRALAPSESIANRALRDGSLLANIEHASWKHDTFVELLSKVSAIAARMMRECDGMADVVEHLDAAADAMEDVFARGVS